MAMKPKLEESNPQLKTAFLEVVDNQLKTNDPPETRQTLDLLIAQGISREDAKVSIAQAVCLEVFNVMKHNNPFDQSRYIRNLQHLPNEPLERAADPINSLKLWQFLIDTYTLQVQYLSPLETF